MKNDKLKILSNLFKLTFLLTLLCSVYACNVAPWERGHLAKREMLISPNPSLASLRSHVFDSKEASTGGSGSIGSGCGCN